MLTYQLCIKKQFQEVMSNIGYYNNTYSRPSTRPQGIWLLRLSGLGIDCSVRVFCQSVHFIRVFEKVVRTTVWVSIIQTFQLSEHT